MHVCVRRVCKHVHTCLCGLQSRELLGVLSQAHCHSLPQSHYAKVPHHPAAAVAAWVHFTAPESRRAAAPPSSRPPGSARLEQTAPGSGCSRLLFTTPRVAMASVPRALPLQLNPTPDQMHTKHAASGLEQEGVVARPAASPTPIKLWTGVVESHLLGLGQEGGLLPGVEARLLLAAPLQKLRHTPAVLARQLGQEVQGIPVGGQQ